MKITLIIFAILFASSLSITNEEAKMVLKGIEFGYKEKKETIELNETCLGESFNDDYKELTDSMNEENYAFMTFKVHRILYEIYANCSSPLFSEILHSTKNLPKLFKLENLDWDLQELLPPLMDIYNSETKTFFEWGTFIGQVIKKANELKQEKKEEEEPINTDL